MRVTLPYPPSANRYWRSFRGRVVKSSEARQYASAVGLMCRAAGLTGYAGDVAVTLRFYRPRRAGDLDNRIKVCLDSLQGHAFADDDQVTEIHAYRYDDKANPRVEVEVMAVGATAPTSLVTSSTSLVGGARRTIKHPAR